MKIKFITGYWGKRNTEELPKTFKAIRKRVTNKNDYCKEKFFFVPVTESDLKDGNTFIYGVGHFNIKKAKVFEIPTYEYDGNSNSLQEYASKYGVYALFYSLTGERMKVLNNDEVMSLIENPEQLKLYENDLLFDKVKEMLQITIDGLDYYKKKHNVYGTPDVHYMPSFRSYGMTMPIYMDAMQLDKDLVGMYKAYRAEELTNTLKEEHNIAWYDYEIKKAYDAFYSIEVKDDETLQRKAKYDTRWRNLSNERREIMNDIIIKVGAQIANELEEDNGVFPQSVYDRAKFLLGERFANAYQELIDLCKSVK